MVHITITIIVCLLQTAQHVSASSLHRQAQKKEGFMKVEALRGDLQAAMAEALGHDHDVEFVQPDVIKQWLTPTFNALPKNAAGHVELQVMEHSVHRYFMQRYSLSLKAFEPHRPLNASELGATEVLGDRAPAFIEEILRGRFYHNGFSLEDAVQMISVMEQFLYDDTVRRLEKVYAKKEEHRDEIGFESATRRVTEFLTDTNEEGYTSIDHGAERVYIQGELERIVYKRQKSKKGRAMLQDGFTFEEVAHAAHNMVLSSERFFSDCSGLHKHMASYDKKKTGRAKLADLYWDAKASGFGILESKDWLRRMGVLDESSTWTGPQVIIPNYVQAASNCVLTTSLYRVCCPNRECQSMFSDIEAHVGRPSAKPAEIWPAILQSMRYDAEMPDMMNAGPLSAKLTQISKHHNEEIPLHGRLFQQWLHYVKPQECPYPYKKGSVQAIDQGSCVSDDCVVKDPKAQGRAENLHVETAMKAKESKGEDVWGGLSGEFKDAQIDGWMSQWDLEEELITAKAPKVSIWDTDFMRRAKALIAAVLLAALFFVATFYGFKAAEAFGIVPKHPSSKTHSKPTGLWADMISSAKVHDV